MRLLICIGLKLSKLDAEFCDCILEGGDLIHIPADDLVGCSHDACQIGDLITKLHKLLGLRPLIGLKLKDPLGDRWMVINIAVAAMLVLLNQQCCASAK